MNNEITKLYSQDLEAGFYMTWITGQVLQRLYAEKPQDEKSITFITTKYDAFTSLLDIMGLMPQYDEFKVAKEAENDSNKEKK